MRKLYLVRHGQNIDNANGILNGHRDEPLTDLGRRQALETARRLLSHGIHFDHLFSSPLSRAFETAAIIADHFLFQTPTVVPLLIERDFGLLTGQPQRKILEVVPEEELIRTPTVQYYDGYGNAEAFGQCRQRAAQALKLIRMQAQRGDVLIVSHGDFSKMLVSSYYDVPWRDVLVDFHFGNGDVIELSPRTSYQDCKIITQEQANT